MNARRIRSVIVFVAFLCVLAAWSSEGNRRMPEKTFYGNGVPWNAQEIDEDTAEQVWIHCRKELEEYAEPIEDFDLYLPHTSSGSFNNIKSDVALLRKRIIHKAVTDLLPQAKQNVLVCLRTKVFPSHGSDKEALSRTWFIKCQEFLSKWYNLPRRYLLTRKRPWIWVQALARARAQALARTRARAWARKHISPAPAPGPAAASPANAAAPSYQVPASSPSPISDPPIRAPEPSLPKDLIDSTPPLPVMHRPPRPRKGPPHIPPQNNNDNSKFTIAAIVGSTVALFALFALFLFCCLRGSKKRIGPRDGQRDDKPLLNFCSSDISGSSQKSHSVGNSSNKDSRTSSMVNNLSIGADTNNPSLAEATLGASGDANVALPLPPGKTAPPQPPPGPPQPPPPKPPAPSPPPPPKTSRPPPNPPKPSNLKKPSVGPYHRGRSSIGEENDQAAGDSDAPKTKLKPFFWDKVLANPDQSMVWHELKAGSFQVNEEMMESLFGYAPSGQNKNERAKPSSSFESPPQYIQIIDSKKAQNLAILLKALNVTTEEVCDALKEGNELPVELIQTLLKMAPSTEEELKLRLFSGELSQLGPAERFLKVVVEIPFAFKRLESLLFMSSLEEELSSVKESFATLEVACTELRNSRLFLKLLEAVLKTGNRMNDGTYRGGAQAIKLDTLLKLSDVKGTDSKTTLLHFVVQEIIRSEGIRAARTLRGSKSISSVKTEDLLEDSNNETEEYHRSLGLQVVSSLSNELEDVRKAAIIDGDALTSTVSKLGRSLAKTKEFVNNEMKGVEEESEFYEALSSFVQHAEDDILWVLEEEKRIMVLVKSTADYFHGNAGKDEGLRLFVIVRDFLIILDKACKEVRNSATKPMKTPRKEALTVSPSQESRQQSLPDVRQRLFIKDRQIDYSSSDDESSSP